MLLWLSSGFLGCEPCLVSGGEFGVVDAAAFEFRDSCWERSELFGGCSETDVAGGSSIA